MNINSITHSIQGYFTTFKDHILQSLNTEQKKVAAIALAIFASLSLIYFACCRKRVKLPPEIQQSTPSPTSVKTKKLNDKELFRSMLAHWKANVLKTIPLKFTPIDDLPTTKVKVHFQSRENKKIVKEYNIYERQLKNTSSISRCPPTSILEILTTRMNEIVQSIEHDSEIADKTRILEYEILFYNANGEEMKSSERLKLTDR